MKKLLCSFLMLCGLSPSVSAYSTLSCSMQRNGLNETAKIVMNHGNTVAGFSWFIDAGVFGSCLISAENFQDMGKGRYVGVNGCEIQSWRQDFRMTLAVMNPEACRSYCSPSLDKDVLELPMSMDLRTRHCSY